MASSGRRGSKSADAVRRRPRLRRAPAEAVARKRRISRAGGAASGLGVVGAIIVLALAAFQLVEEGAPAGALSGDVRVGLSGGGVSRAATAPAQSADFDYYVLALSWSPAYCRGRPDADQCGEGRRFILHGLWPQYEDGWPQDCAGPRPSRSTLARFERLTGDEGLLAHQWRKHGTCSGLTADAYFAASERAMAAIKSPPELASLSRDARVAPRLIEDAILRANPELRADGVTIKCKDGRFSEVRICLTRDLEPRRCGRDARRDCGAGSIALPAPR